jgi:hypothetical protein
LPIGQSARINILGKIMMSISKKLLCAMISLLAFNAHSENLIQFIDPVEVNETTNQ